MRVTNSMISKNSMNNMNNNKINVDKLNNQMSSQKKISRPSEDPVIAIRALRLRSNLSELNQYYERNIPDARSWMEVTEGALENMKTLLGDIHKKCVRGAHDTLTEEDRASILKDLQSMREQIYAEGNSECVGRTVFTGYKTNSKLTFMKDEKDTAYEITEPISYQDIDEKRFYSNNVKVPSSSEEVLAGVPMNEMPQEYTFSRIRLSYEGMDTLDPNNLKYKAEDGTMQNLSDLVFPTNGGYDFAVVTTDLSYNDWVESGYKIDPNQAIFFKETGELILGSDLANYMGNNKTELSVTYTKKGFSEGELRPEHYFDCKNITDPDHPLEYTKSDQEIKFTVAFNQDIVVNTQASDMLTHAIGRDVDELTNAVEAAIAAHDNVKQIEAMQTQAQYADEDSQKALAQWLEAAKKEATYADDNLKKVYGRGETNFQKYKNNVVLAQTDLGSRESRLDLTENRMSNQQLTIEKLKSRNEDKELSDIIIEFTAAYSAYQASLQASAKANSQTLLNYL